MTPDSMRRNETRNCRSAAVSEERRRSRIGGCSYAEDYHQQYLYKVPHGYCPDHSTGVSCPIGLNLG